MTQSSVLSPVATVGAMAAPQPEWETGRKRLGGSAPDRCGAGWKGARYDRVSR
jgi:hypothetical protein